MKFNFALSLFIALQYTGFSQNNPNDVSIFYRVEAIVMSIELFEADLDAGIYTIDPSWIEAHTPAKYVAYEANSSGIILPSLGHVDFERFDDCRIKEIRITDQGNTSWYYKILFDYDLSNRTITMTTVDLEDGIGPDHYYWRFTFTYDAEENITKLERYFYEETPNDFVLNAVWNYTQFDNCGNYTLFDGGEIGWTTDHLGIQRSYVPGTCLQKNAVFTDLTDNSLFKTIDWEYDANNHLVSADITEDNWCGNLRLDYDPQGRRNAFYYGDCNFPQSSLINGYSWNADNSLAWFDFEPSTTDTFTRFLVEYASCGSLSTEDLGVENASIRVKSPVHPGEITPVFGLPGNGNIPWELRDAQGRVVNTGTISGETQVLIPENTAAGVYFLTFRTAKQIKTVRLLIL